MRASALSTETEAVPTGTIELKRESHRTTLRREESQALPALLWSSSCRLPICTSMGRLAGYCLRTRTILSLGVIWRYERIREIRHRQDEWVNLRVSFRA